MEELLQKYFQGLLDESQRIELFRAMESDAMLKNEFIRLQNITALSQLSEQAKDKTEGTKKYRQFEKNINKRNNSKSFYSILRYAAAAIFLILSTAGITFYFANKYNNSDNVPMSTLYVPAGQRARLTLSDGTEVWLNAQSTLVYPSVFSKKERNVTVTGEAFFKVTKDAKRPFIVSAQNVKMKVLGTQFNVYSYPDAEYFRTSLLEGSVEVSDENSKTVILKPNEQVTYRDGKMKVESITSPDYFLWRDGIYSFENEPLRKIIAKLELYYDVKIIVKDPNIFNVTYTGKFRQRDGIDEILRIIRKIHRFKIQKDVENNIITLSK